MAISPHYAKQISSVKNTYEFNLIFKDAVKINHEFLGIYAISLRHFSYKLQHSKRYNRELDSNMLVGFSINKKVAKAAKRNLIKRRIKAIILQAKREHNLHNIALIFVCRKGILEWDFSALNKHVLQSSAKLQNMLFNNKGSQKRQR